MTKCTAWAVVGIKSQRILRNLRGHYAIYTHRMDAVNDMPEYGEIRRVSMRLIRPNSHTTRGVER